MVLRLELRVGAEQEVKPFLILEPPHRYNVGLQFHRFAQCFLREPLRFRDIEWNIDLANTPRQARHQARQTLLDPLGDRYSPRQMRVEKLRERLVIGGATVLNVRGNELRTKPTEGFAGEFSGGNSEVGRGHLEAPPPAHPSGARRGAV